MARTNDVVAALLREYAELLAITGADPFRMRNYEKAAKAVGGYAGDVDGMTAAALTAIPGVGKSIAGKIAEYQATGTIAALDELRGKVPPGVRELTKVPGLGPKRAMQLSRELGIASVTGLDEAVRQGRLRNLAGFGAKSEERILRGLAVMTHDRVLLSTAMDTATSVIAALGPLAEQVSYAGSLRRMRETIGDVDILATAGSEGDAAAIMAAFREFGDNSNKPNGDGKSTDNSKRPSGEDRGDEQDNEDGTGSAFGVVVSGPTKTSIRVAAGPARQSLQVDLRVVKPDCYGAALQYFTGSQAHNVAVRQIAVRAGLKLSEYGLFRVRDGADEELIASATEEEVYAALGLQWVPPPMREDSGEVSLASRGELPTPVQVTDMRGDLHTHTNLTDGVATLAEMVAAAERKGYQYYAVTDHAPNLFMQRMTDEKVLAQRAELEAIKTGMTLLHGSELNIAPDGSVDWDEDFLSGFDMCVASVQTENPNPKQCVCGPASRPRVASTLVVQCPRISSSTVPSPMRL